MSTIKPMNYARLSRALSPIPGADYKSFLEDARGMFSRLHHRLFHADTNTVLPMLVHGIGLQFDFYLDRSSVKVPTCIMPNAAARVDGLTDTGAGMTLVATVLEELDREFTDPAHAHWLIGYLAQSLRGLAAVWDAEFEDALCGRSRG